MNKIPRFEVHIKYGNSKQLGNYVTPAALMPNGTIHVLEQGVKLIFFSDSHLAPKFLKVVANSKKVGRHFERQTRPFFTLSSF